MAIPVQSGWRSGTRCLRWEPSPEHLSGIDLEELAERGRGQRAEIEECRLRAAHETFDARIGQTVGDERR